MRSTYQKAVWFSDKFPPEETRDVPLFGFVTGSLISLALWVFIAWLVWVVIS